MTVNVAFSINESLAEPMVVTANSILQNTAQPSLIRFHILIPPGTSSIFKAAIAAGLPDYLPQFRLQEYLPPTYLQTYLDAKFKPKDTVRRHSRYMQYSRLFFREAFPDLGRLIYLDADVIVLGDIAELYAQGDRLTAHCFLGAVPQFFPAVLYFSNPFKIWSEVRQFQKTFNSGVLLMDLNFWQPAIYEQLQYYLNLDAQHDYRLYHLGDETVLNLMFKQSYLPLEAQWNRCGYGNARPVTWFLQRDLSQIKILHWSGGHHKPWRSPNIAFGDLWYRYRPNSLG